MTHEEAKAHVRDFFETRKQGLCEDASYLGRWFRSVRAGLFTGEPEIEDGGVASFSIKGARSGYTDLLEAAQSDPDAYDAALRLTARMVRQGKPLPRDLADWVADVLEGTARRPRRHGAHPHSNRFRDLYIAMAVWKLTEKGMQPTRNEASNSVSACDIVASVLPEYGIGMGYHGVRKAWDSYQRLR